MRILCVDDDGLTLAVTADLLRELGHEVMEATDGHHAARAIGEAGPLDLLVTDLHMPGMGGLDLALLAQRARPGLPVIFFSGLSHIVPNELNGRLLRKPCSLGELEQAIEGVVH